MQSLKLVSESVFLWQGKCSVAVTFFISSMISPFLELGLGSIRRRIGWEMQWYHWIGAEFETRVGIRFFVDMVSVLFRSIAVTFYNSYMISPFLEHSSGIIRRRIRWWMQWYHWIGVECESRVAIRVFVTEVSVLSSFLSSSLFTIRKPSHQFYCMSDASINAEPNKECRERLDSIV